MIVFAVFSGGFLGGLGRVMLGRLLGPRPGILAANLIACFLIGAVSHLGNVFLSVGVAGALSTWPAFALQVVDAWDTRRREAIKLTAVTLIGCTAAAWLGTLI